MTISSSSENDVKMQCSPLRPSVQNSKMNITNRMDALYSETFRSGNDIHCNPFQSLQAHTYELFPNHCTKNDQSDAIAGNPSAQNSVGTLFSSGFVNSNNMTYNVHSAFTHNAADGNHVPKQTNQLVNNQNEMDYQNSIPHQVTDQLNINNSFVYPSQGNSFTTGFFQENQPQTTFQQQQIVNNNYDHHVPFVKPILTVQDRPMIPPVYNGVNPNYPGLRLLNVIPPIFAVDNFLTPGECDFLIHVPQDSFAQAPVIGVGAGEISPSRTSSTFYLAREDVPKYMAKVSVLTGKSVEHCELPQVGRYLPTQQYVQHFDAFDFSDKNGIRVGANGGQRTVTVLVYLNDVQKGGQTVFPALNLQVQPKKGMALVFFPATVDGLLDKMALHAALPAIDTKYVSQVWLRQFKYEGQPSKRLRHPLDNSIQ